MPLEAIIFDARVPWLATRSRRAIAYAGFGVAAEVASMRDLVDALEARAGAPTWIVRAGAVPVALGRAARALAEEHALAVGAIAADESWRSFLATTNGDLASAGVWPRVESLATSDPRRLVDALRGTVSLGGACLNIAKKGDVTVAHVAGLDVIHRDGLIAVEVVTTLHRGGAERIVLDLVAHLRATGVHVPFVVVDRPLRTTYDAPPDTTFFADKGKTRSDRIEALGDFALRRGADVLHVHLLDGDDIRALVKFGVPIVVTLHNGREGWPAGLGSIEYGEVALFVGCARDVTREVVEAGLPAAVRTVWNAIDPSTVPKLDGATRAAVRAGARKTLGVDDDALLLLAVANHRPQKRLERMPAIVAELQRRGHKARLVIVGEPERVSDEALGVSRAVSAEAERLGVGTAIRLTGSLAETRSLYAGADVVLSTSAFEGLSLVHLEALAAGTPLVSSRVNGTAELAKKHEHVRLVSVDAPARVYADAVEDVTRRGAGGTTKGLAPDFASKNMGERQSMLLERVVTAWSAPVTSARKGIVLVTNNFAIGGAQSSARRLLRRLHASYIPVRAIVIEEQPEYPTPGRVALERAGIVVDVAPRAGFADALATARAVVARIDEAAPAAVLFWNVLPEHKILVAEMLLDVAVWDVSPGETTYTAFDKYFAKPRAGVPVMDLRDYGRLLTGVVVKTTAEQKTAAESMGTVVEVIPNGVEIPKAARTRPHDPNKQVVVGTLARLAPEKKLEQLVDAIAHVRTRLGPCDVVIGGAAETGGEAYAAELKARAQGLPIRFVGARDSKAFMSELDLFVLVSEPSGCPNAGLEAMAEALPIIATDHGGAREQVEHGKNGLLVARGDTRALGDAIALLVDNHQKRAAMGAASWARAQERFDVERMARDYVRVVLDQKLEPPTRPAITWLPSY